MSLKTKSVSYSVGVNLSVFQFAVQHTLELEKQKEELLRAEEEKKAELKAEEERKAEQLLKDEEIKKELAREEEKNREFLEAQENQRLSILAEEEAKIDALIELEELRREAIKIEEQKKEDLLKREQEAFALLQLHLQTIERASPELSVTVENETTISGKSHFRDIGSPALTYDPPGSDIYGKPSLWKVEQAEDLRKKYEEFQREKREQDLFKRFDGFHDRQQTEQEERKRLREELEKRLEEQHKLELEREKKRREHFRELYSERER